MKKFLLAFCILLASSVYFYPAFAQIKLGHINSAELLSMLPESKVADGDLKKFGESLEGQLRTMNTEYQSKVQDYQSKESLMADAIKQTKQKEIIDLENRIQAFQEQGQSDIQKKKEELYTPILKKAQDAINAIAKEGSYTYVYDSSLGTLLYAQESNDLMSAVKKRLGLNAPVEAGDKKTDTAKPSPDKPAIAPKK